MALLCHYNDLTHLADTLLDRRNGPNVNIRTGSQWADEHEICQFYTRSLLNILYEEGKEERGEGPNSVAHACTVQVMTYGFSKLMTYGFS